MNLRWITIHPGILLKRIPEWFSEFKIRRDVRIKNIHSPPFGQIKGDGNGLSWISYLLIEGGEGKRIFPRLRSVSIINRGRTDADGVFLRGCNLDNRDTKKGVVLIKTLRFVYPLGPHFVPSFVKFLSSKDNFVSQSKFPLTFDSSISPQKY